MLDHRPARRDLDHLTRALSKLLAEEPGEILELHVTRPPDLEAIPLKRLVAAQAAELGLDFLTVVPHDAPGPIRLTEVVVSENGSPRTVRPGDA